MSDRRHKNSKPAAIVQYLLTHSRQTTAAIAQAVGTTSTKVGTALWAEMRRTPCVIVRDELPPVGGRTKPTYVYSHVDYKEPVETTKPEPVESEMTTYLNSKLTARDLDLRPGPVRAIPPEPVGTLTDFADALAKAIAQHVVSRVKDHLETQLRGILPPLKDNPTPISIEQLTTRVITSETTKTRLPTVVIAGLLPTQAGIIEKEFGDVYDLRFYMVGENLKQLATMVANVDHVFTFTSKVSHAVEEVMAGKGHKIHRCSGGMTMLKDQLLKLYMGEL